MVKFKDPIYKQGHIYTADILPGAKMPDPVLGPQDFQTNHKGEYKGANNFRGGGRGGGGYGGRGYGGGGRGGGGFRGGVRRPQLGFTPQSGYRTDSDATSANRMLRASLNNVDRHNQGASIDPGSAYGGRNNYGRGGGNNYDRGGRSDYSRPPRGAPNRPSRPPRGAHGGGGGPWQQQQGGNARFQRPAAPTSYSTGPRPYANQQRGHHQDNRHRGRRRGQRQNPYQRY